MPANQTNGELVNKVQYIPLSYNNAESQTSALRLILTLFPDWETSEGKVEFIRFTDGKTNTLLKAVKRRPGYTEDQIDREAVLLRAYGTGTEVIIDRDRETKSHTLLSQYKLAPPLLARLQNGLLYRYIRGRVCTSEDLTCEDVWRGVARRLGEWHARLPILGENPKALAEISELDESLLMSPSKLSIPLKAINAITPGKSTPNLWTVLQKWIFTLPTTTDAEKKRKSVLQKELERTVAELGNTPGLGRDGLVFGHCDLLSGNVIIHPQPRSSNSTSQAVTVSFIDYEYATPCPAAFDIANHFAEWGGFDCDYNVLPTRSVRRAFIREYLTSYTTHSPLRHQGRRGSEPSSRDDRSGETMDKLEQRLFDDVDRFRGIPGFFWGLWALIQAGISQIDFDYRSYAEVRLEEYWAWKAETERTRKGKMSERERRWGQE